MPISMLERTSDPSVPALYTQDLGARPPLLGLFPLQRYDKHGQEAEEQERRIRVNEQRLESSPIPHSCLPWGENTPKHPS